jgi:hypothetical protein
MAFGNGFEGYIKDTYRICMYSLENIVKSGSGVCFIKAYIEALEECEWVIPYGS